MKKIVFGMDQLRSIKVPVLGGVVTKFVGSVSLGQLPKDFSLDPNPREQDLTSKVSKQIAKTAENEPEWFPIYNKGLTLVASTVDILTRRDNGGVVVEVAFDEGEGLLDGGHTYRKVLELLESGKGDSQMLVPLEILVGIDPEQRYLVASARNTTDQVTEQAIANQRGDFNMIKEALGRYQDKFAFTQNQKSEFITADILDLMAIMTLFDRMDYDRNTPPVKAYSAKQSCFKDWLVEAKRENYKKLYHLLPTILELHDHLWSNFELYAPTIGRYKGVAEENSGKTKRHKKKTNIILPFTDKNVRLPIPQSFIYPILSSLRMLLREDQHGGVEFAENPFEFLDRNGAALTRKLLEVHTTRGSNSTETGKDKILWQSLGQEVSLILTDKLAAI